jgi:hypothetical protein
VHAAHESGFKIQFQDVLCVCVRKQDRALRRGGRGGELSLALECAVFVFLFQEESCPLPQAIAHPHGDGWDPGVSCLSMRTERTDRPRRRLGQRRRRRVWSMPFASGLPTRPPWARGDDGEHRGAHFYPFVIWCHFQKLFPSLTVLLIY